MGCEKLGAKPKSWRPKFYDIRGRLFHNQRVLWVFFEKKIAWKSEMC
jgi:hypothetical protein